MALLRVVYYPEDVLTTAAEPVTTIDGTIATFMDDMAETMYQSHGVGLAAPQVGLSRRILTMDVDPDENGKGLLQLANPEVIESHGEITWEEGCLSFPGITVEVVRHARVLVSAINRDGEEIEVEADGLAAVCLQHEIDHLDGITFLERLKGLKRRLVLREYLRIRRQIDRGEWTPNPFQ